MVPPVNENAFWGAMMLDCSVIPFRFTDVLLMVSDTDKLSTPAFMSNVNDIAVGAVVSEITWLALIELGAVTAEMELPLISFTKVESNEMNVLSTDVPSG